VLEFCSSFRVVDVETQQIVSGRGEPLDVVRDPLRLCGAGDGLMAPVNRCGEFRVACAPGDESCEECVLRTLTPAREAGRERIEAQRRARAESVKGSAG
jgi:hypothetical protein